MYNHQVTLKFLDLFSSLELIRAIVATLAFLLFLAACQLADRFSRTETKSLEPAIEQLIEQPVEQSVEKPRAVAKSAKAEIPKMHNDDLIPDAGYFSTLSLRSSSASHPACRGLTSQAISFPEGSYDHSPNIAGGFAMLDLAVRVPISNSSSWNDKQSRTKADAVEEGNKKSRKWKYLPVRANVVGSNISPTSVHIGLETWNGGIMQAAAATWIEHKYGARDTQFGQFDTMDVLEIWRKKQSRASKSARSKAKSKRELSFEDINTEDMEQSQLSNGAGSQIAREPSDMSDTGVLSTASPIEVPSSPNPSGNEEDEDDNRLAESDSDLSTEGSTSVSDVESDAEDDEDEDYHLPTTYHHTVHFSRSYSSSPTVLTWLNRIDLILPPAQSASKPPPFCLSTTCQSTTPTSTTLVLTTSRQSSRVTSSTSTTPSKSVSTPVSSAPPSVISAFSTPSKTHASSSANQAPSATLRGAALCYISFPSTKSLVASGHVVVASHTSIRSSLTGRVRFPSSKFKSAPTVLAALSGFEVPGDVTNLRVGVQVTWTTNEAFGWEILGPEYPADKDEKSDQDDDAVKKRSRTGGKWRVEVNWIAMGFR
jgi:hypothetical protein